MKFVVWICNSGELFCSDIDKTIPVSAFSSRNMDFRAFSEIGKTEHICHKSFLLTVAAGDSQYVLSPGISAQQKMAEILISVHDKTVAAETAVFSA